MALKFLSLIRAKFFSNPSDTAVEVGLAQENHPRLGVDAGGRLRWGSGSGATDVTLYRDSADVLKTDDTFKANRLFVSDVEIETVPSSDGMFLAFDGEKYTPSVSPSNEPIGFSNKEESSISFDEESRRFTISAVNDYFYVWCKGVRFQKEEEQVTIPNESGLYFVFFNENGVLGTRKSFFNWELEAPVSYIYWNAEDSAAYFVADERHGVVLDWQTHEYLHRTRGAALASGFGITNYSLNGNGSSDLHAKIDIQDGVFFDEDLEVVITHSSTPTPNTWQQTLQGGARIPVMYRQGAGLWKMDSPTEFPLKQGTALPQYNFLASGLWSTQDLGNNQYGVSWVVATNNVNYPVVVLLGQRPYANLNAVHESNWADLDLTDLPVFELRPLYKVVYLVRTTYTNTPKAAIREVIDIRRVYSDSEGAPITATVDHGSLLGLSDDDHPQYLTSDRADALYLRTEDQIILKTSSGSLSTSPNQLIDETSADCVKYVIYIESEEDKEVLEFLAISDGVTTNFVEFARVGTSSLELSSFTATYFGDKLQLRVSPLVDVPLVYRIVKTVIN
jgi:hypothetical protein